VKTDTDTGANIGYSMIRNISQVPTFQFDKESDSPNYKDLQSDELLSKCLHGSTQNANESLHDVIWTCVLKQTFVSKKKLLNLEFTLQYSITTMELMVF